jgi:hypothetical protein
VLAEAGLVLVVAQDSLVGMLDPDLSQTLGQLFFF